MSQPAVALAPLPFELVTSDGEPLESEWHVLQLHLTWELLRQTMAEQSRTDYYVGGDMFVYYSIEQARDVVEEESKGREKRAFRGPDVFWVGGVPDPDRNRTAWISWEEGGRLPDVILELLSPSTSKKDRTEKRDLYARVFGTAEYFMADPDRRRFEGLRLFGQTYRPIPPDEHGRVWSEQLGVFLGLWNGVIQGRRYDWIRLFRPDGTLVPTTEEQAAAERQRAEAERQRAESEHQRAETERQIAEAERQKAEAERQRAEAAEAELARLRALLEKRDGQG